MSTGPKKVGRGGRRPGAGRPRKTVDRKRAEAMWREARRRAKELGHKKLPTEVLLDFIYDSDLNETVRLKACDIWLKHAMVTSESGAAKGAKSAVIGLPARRPDPAKVVPMRSEK